MGKSLIFHVRRQCVGCMIFVFHDWVAFKLFIMSLTGFITAFKINFIIFNISLFLFLIPGPWLLSSW